MCVSLFVFATLDATELAGRIGLHPNTIRFHLGVLLDAGLVASRPAERAAPGRPRILYALRPEAAAAEHDEYRLLATILAGTVAHREDGATEAEHAGRAGDATVRSPSPLEQLTNEQATLEVVELLDQQGFAPERGESEIRMRRCPYHELAETQPDIVCAVHRGLISGALEELGSELEIHALDVFVQPDLGIARLGAPGPDRVTRGERRGGPQPASGSGIRMSDCR